MDHTIGLASLTDSSFNDSAKHFIQSLPAAQQSALFDTMAMAQGLAVISPLAICVAFFSTIGTICIGISVLPQTIDTVKNHQTQTFSWLMYVFLVVGCFFLAIYGIGLVVAGARMEDNYYTYGNAKIMYEVLKTHGWTGNVDINYALALAGEKAVPNGNGHFATTAKGDLVNWDKVGVYKGDDYTIVAITPSDFQNYKVNYTTPGGLLILGEGFASITSAIVLYYKFENMIKAKREGISEAQYCEKLLAEIKAKKGATK